MKGFLEGPVLVILIVTLASLFFFGKGLYEGIKIDPTDRTTFAEVWYWTPELTEQEIEEWEDIKKEKMQNNGIGILLTICLSSGLIYFIREQEAKVH
jgi:hypothetical protein